MAISQNDSPINPDFLTLDELATRMGISLTVAYELAKVDRLPIPALKVGRQYRFSRRAYEALLDARHGDRAGEVA